MYIFRLLIINSMVKFIAIHLQLLKKFNHFNKKIRTLIKDYLKIL